MPAEVGLARASKRRGDGERRPFRGGDRSSSTSSCARPIRELALERAAALRADRCHRADARRSPSASGRWSTTGSIRRPRRSRSKASRRERRRRRGSRASRTRARPPALFGHAEAEQALLEAYRSGRLPHAWLIGGPAGIGKATLAYRMARFVLAHPDPQAPAVRSATLARASMPTIRWRGASRRRRTATCWCSSARSTKRPASCARTSRSMTCAARSSFFGSTAGEGGWRVAIVDAVDELNAAGANALLKVLEEPPRARAAAAGQPFRRRACCRPSARAAGCCRCGRSPTTTSRAPRPPRSARSAGRSRHRGRRRGRRGQRRAARSPCSMATRWRLRSRIIALLDRLPAVDPRALHALGDRLAGTDAAPLAAFVDTRQCLAVRAARRRARRSRASPGARGRGLGEGQPAPRATPRLTISSASRWFSTCSAGLPRPRAVDTYALTCHGRACPGHERL